MTITADNAQLTVGRVYKTFADMQDYFAQTGSDYTTLTDVMPASSFVTVTEGTVYFPATDFDAHYFLNKTNGTNTEATYLTNTCSLSGAITWGPPATLGVVEYVTSIAVGASITFEQACIALDAAFRQAGDMTPGYCIQLGPQDVTPGIYQQCGIVPASGIKFYGEAFALVYLSENMTDTDFRIFFSEFRDIDYVDWQTVDDVGTDYDAFLKTWYGMSDDSALWMEAPWVMTFLENDVTASCLMTPFWEWAANSSAHKSGPTTQCLIDSPGSVAIRRNRVQGKGRALQFLFQSENGKPFNLLGWSVSFDRNADY